MQPGDEAAAVDLLAAAGAMAEADDVGPVLAQPAREGKPLGVKGEGDEPGLAVAVIAHQEGQLAACLESAGAVADELAVAAEKLLQRRGAGQVTRVVGVELLPPVGRVCPDEIERLGIGKASGLAGVNAAVD